LERKFRDLYGGHSTLHIKITAFWDMTSLNLVEKFQQNCVTSPKTVITKNKVLVCRRIVF